MTLDKIRKTVERGIWTREEAIANAKDAGIPDVEIIAAFSVGDHRYSIRVTHTSSQWRAGEEQCQLQAESHQAAVSAYYDHMFGAGSIVPTHHEVYAVLIS